MKNTKRAFVIAAVLTFAAGVTAFALCWLDKVLQDSYISMDDYFTGY